MSRAASRERPAARSVSLTRGSHHDDDLGRRGSLAAFRALVPDAPARATTLIHAARLLLPTLERGQPIDAAVLRAAMEHAVGTSDTDWVPIAATA